MDLTLEQIVSTLLEGTQITIWITLASTVGGAILAFASGIGSIARFAPARWLAKTYIQIFRGTSLLVQLFWLYYALPVALGIRIGPVEAGILGLSLNIGAYGAEVVRGALQSVDAGQHEAAIALNFTPRQTLWRVLLPQAMVEMMPPFGNLAIQNLKDSSLVSLISLTDLAFKADHLRNRGYDSDTLPILGVTLLLYFAIALVLMAAMRLLERYFERVSGRVGAH